MYIVIPGHQRIRVEAESNKITRTHQDNFVKREVIVGNTLSTVFALGYLALWLTGVGICAFYYCGCSFRGRQRKGEKRRGKQPERFQCDKKGSRKSETEAPAIAVQAGVHFEQQQTSGKIYTWATPWVVNLEKVHTHQWGGSHGASARSTDSRLPARASLSAVNEEPGWVSPTRSMAIQGHKPTKFTRNIAAGIGASINSEQLSPYSRRSQAIEEGLSPKNAFGEVYGGPIHQLASAATSSTSLRTDLYPNDRSEFTRITIPSLDDLSFPLPDPDHANRRSSVFPTRLAPSIEKLSLVSSSSAPSRFSLEQIQDTNFVQGLTSLSDNRGEHPSGDMRSFSGTLRSDTKNRGK